MFESFTVEELMAYIADRERVLVKEQECLRAARLVFDEAPPANKQGARDALAMLAAMASTRDATDQTPDIFSPDD